MPSKAPEEIRAVEARAPWSVALRIWLAMVWRILLAMLLGMFLFLLVEYFLWRGQDVQELRSQFLAVFLIPFAIWSVRSVLNKDFGGHRVVVVKKAKNAPEEKNRTDSAE